MIASLKKVILYTIFINASVIKTGCKQVIKIVKYETRFINRYGWCNLWRRRID